jgi:putative restriction endonuclease
MTAATKSNWSRQETVAALHVYLQLSFGQLHARNALIKQFSVWIGRTANSVALKLVNFASLDPQILASGRKGMGNSSALDKSIWNDLNQNWTSMTLEAAKAYEALAINNGTSPAADVADDLTDAETDFPEGKMRSAIVQVRVNQARFRKTVLASYNNTCCISGLKNTQLLVASHIVPWRMDKENRLNPRNGLCLSALHDRAFDQGLLSISSEGRVLVSKSMIREKSESAFAKHFLECQGAIVQIPERFAPDNSFLKWHRENLFTP